MRYFKAVILFSLILQSCSKYSHHTDELSVVEFRKKYNFDICEKSIIKISNEKISTTLRWLYNAYTIDFPNEDCLKIFFDEAERRSELYDILGENKYSRTQGILRGSEVIFILNRMGKNQVGITVQK